MSPEVNERRECSSSTPEALSRRLSRTAAQTFETAKKAGLLLAKSAERTKLKTRELPAAYRALGRHVFERGQLSSVFSDAHQEINELIAQVSELEQKLSDAPQNAKGIGEKTRNAAILAKHHASLEVLKAKISTCMTKLGKSAFERDANQSGSSELVQPIIDCHEKIGQLDEDIAGLSASPPGQLLTPKRMVFGGLAVILLAGLTWRFLAGSNANGLAATDIDPSRLLTEEHDSPQIDVPRDEISKREPIKVQESNSTVRGRTVESRLADPQQSVSERGSQSDRDKASAALVDRFEEMTPERQAAQYLATTGSDRIVILGRSESNSASQFAAAAFLRLTPQKRKQAGTFSSLMKQAGIPGDEATYHGKREFSSFVSAVDRYVAAYSKDNNGPLHLAVDCENIELCKALLQVGENPAMRNGNGESPLNILTVKFLTEPKFDSQKFKDYAATLVKGGASWHEKDARGSSLFLKAADVLHQKKTSASSGESTYHRASLERLIEFCQYLHERGVDLGSRATDGQGFLHRLAQSEACFGEKPAAWETLCQFALSNGCDLNAADSAGETALHVAAAYLNAPLVASLLQGGANPNAVSKRKLSPLLRTCKELRETYRIGVQSRSRPNRVRGLTDSEAKRLADVVISELIHAGADYKIRNSDGLYAASYLDAARRGKLLSVELRPLNSSAAEGVGRPIGSADERLFCLFNDGISYHVQAFNADGHCLSKVRLPKPISIVSSRVRRNGSVALFVKGAVDGKTLYGETSPDGKKITMNEVSKDKSIISLTDKGTLVRSSQNAGVYTLIRLDGTTALMARKPSLLGHKCAYNLDQGVLSRIDGEAPRWTLPTQAKVRTASVDDDTDELFVSVYSDHVIKASTDGRLEWSVKVVRPGLDGRILLHVRDNSLLAFGKEITALDKESGKMLWSTEDLDFAGSPDSIFFDKDGDMYLIYGQNIYCVRADGVVKGAIRVSENIGTFQSFGAFPLGTEFLVLGTSSYTASTVRFLDWNYW